MPNKSGPVSQLVAAGRCCAPPARVDVADGGKQRSAWCPWYPHKTPISPKMTIFTTRWESTFYLAEAVPAAESKRNIRKNGLFSGCEYTCRPRTFMKMTKSREQKP